jgi:hypothetical protein
MDDETAREFETMILRRRAAAGESRAEAIAWVVRQLRDSGRSQSADELEGREDHLRGPAAEAWRDQITADAQRYPLVLIDGVLRERQASDTPRCGDCGVPAGLLHWPGCDQDWTVDGLQILGELVMGSELDAFRTREGEPCPPRQPFPAQP